MTIELANISACPDGGVTLNAVNGTASVCNGAQGDPGPAGTATIYHASVYLNGIASNVGNSPEFTGSSRIGIGLYNIGFSVNVSPCGRVATLGNSERPAEQLGGLQGLQRGDLDIF